MPRSPWACEAAMKTLALLTTLFALATLAGCGADSAPTPPDGVTVSGEASMGVSGGS